MKNVGFVFSLFLCLSAGCSTVGKIENVPISNQKQITVTDESLFTAARNLDSDGITLLLAFSGGGTRASALSYGVMEELRDTQVVINGKTMRLLDEIDLISAVSGGSFTAAYYGLFRERLFSDYKEQMLTRSLSSQIIHTVLNPLRWLSASGRTDYAVDIYADAGFENKTMGDMLSNGPPLVAINATDLSQGSRFTFLQDYFNLLCSDLSNFPVARAVAASSAVPVLFNPVVVKNYADCNPSELNSYLLPRTFSGPLSLQDAARSALSYGNKQERPFVHLVDGGISDNLGLRMMLDTVEFAGGMKNYLDLAHQGQPYAPARHFVIIVVNASVKADTDIDKASTPPSITQTLNAVTDAQLHLYNNETLQLAQSLLHQWESDMGTAERAVSSHLIVVELKTVEPALLRNRLNLIPTTLGLPEAEVDLLIETGRNLLRENEEFRKLLQSLSEGFKL